MKSIIIIALLLAFTLPALANNADTIHVQPNTLQLKNLQIGKQDYLLFYKKTKNGPASRLTLVTFNVETIQYHNKSAFAIKQQWEADTVIHKCYTVFDAKDFSTLFHDTFWKRLGYSIKLDFETRQVEFTNVNVKGGVPDSVKAIATSNFNQSFNSYSLNWHADMLIAGLLPFKEGRTCIINYYDPGFDKAEDVTFTVTGSETLSGSNGDKIDCWVLNNYTDDKAPDKGYERFWISKKTHEVLKLEDSNGPGRGYRYKVKLGVALD